MIATHSAYITQYDEAQDLQTAARQLVSQALMATHDHDAQALLTLSSTHKIHNLKDHFPLQFKELGATVYYNRHASDASNISNIYTITLDLNFSNPFEF